MKTFKRILATVVIIAAIVGAGVLYIQHARASYNVPLASAGQWVKVTKSYTDFATASLTNDISIYTLPTKGYVHDVKIVPRVAFSGGVISATTISVGISGSLAKYAIAANVFTGNTTLGLVHTPIAGLENTAGTTDIRASIIAVGVAQTLNNLSAGTVDIYLYISTLP